MPALPGRTNHIRAGVLVGLRLDPEPVCILTLRSRSLRQHGGEICYPGGRPEPGDVDLTQTALREAREELGITRVELLGRLSSIPVYTSDHRLEPVVGLVEDAVLAPDPAEVAAVYEVSLRSILQRRFIRAVPWQWGDRQWLSPVFDIEGERLYGATAHSFLELLRVIAPLVGIPVPCLQTGGMQWADLLSGSSEALR